MKSPNRFDDLAVGDRVKPTAYTGRLPAGEFEVLHIVGEELTLRTTNYRAKHDQFTTERSEVTFACHNQGAPFTSYTGGKETGYADGFETGWNWNRKRWNHTPGGPHCATDLPSHARSPGCRHKQAYDAATIENFHAWHKGFKAGEAARAKVPFDPLLPLELDTGKRPKLRNLTPLPNRVIRYISLTQMPEWNGTLAQCPEDDGVGQKVRLTFEGQKCVLTEIVR